MRLVLDGGDVLRTNVRLSFRTPRPRATVERVGDFNAFCHTSDACPEAFPLKLPPQWRLFDIHHELQVFEASNRGVGPVCEGLDPEFQEAPSKPGQWSHCCLFEAPNVLYVGR